MFASSRSFLKNSYTLPRIAFDPDLIVALTTAPELRPNSAEYAFVWILNSCSASIDGCTSCTFSPRNEFEYEMLSTPSSRNTLLNVRLPFTFSTPLKFTLASLGVPGSTPGDRSASWL